MIAIFKRELREYYGGLLGYVLGALLLLFAGIFVMALQLRQGYGNFAYVLNYLSFLLILVVPLLTMGSFAGERQRGTELLLLSLPVTLLQVVLGKFLAAAVVLGLPCAIMAMYPPVLATLGEVNLPLAYGALLGFFLLGLALVAFGQLVSSLVDNPLVAAGGCAGALLLVYYSQSVAGYITASLVGTLIALTVVVLLAGVLVGLSAESIWAGAGVTMAGELVLLACAMTWRGPFSQLLVAAVKKLALFRQLFEFSDGVLDGKILLWYLSLTVFCLFLTVQSLERRRWNG